MTTIHVSHEYVMETAEEVALPEGKTWADVECWSLKSLEFCVRFKDGTEMRKRLNEPENFPDTERPERVIIFDGALENTLDETA